MKQSIKVAKLQEALLIVKPAVAFKEVIEQSTSFAFLEGKVIAYNDEISISHPLPELDFRGAVKADDLYQTLTKLKKDDIELELFENELKLTCGRVKAGLTLKSEIVLPLEEVGEIGDWSSIPAKFLEHLDIAIYACSNDMSRPLLTCVSVANTGIMYGSDGYKLVQCIGEVLDVDDFLLPAASALQVVKLKPNKIARSKGWVHFSNTAGTRISCRIFEEAYPKVEHLLTMEGITVSFPKVFGQLLEKAVVFSKRDHFLDECVTIKLRTNKILVRGESDTGWLEEEANMKYSGEDVEFLITPSLLKNVEMSSTQCVVGTSRIKFIGPSWQYLVVLRVSK